MNQQLEKQALVARLARWGATPIANTPKLLMDVRSPAQLDALETGIRQTLHEGTSQKIYNQLQKVPSPSGRFGKVVDMAKETVAQHPETIPMSAVPVPGIAAGYLAAKKGLKKALGIPELALQKVAQVIPYQQETQWTCSAACLSAVLKHYGYTVSEWDLLDVIGVVPDKGAEVDQIAVGAQKMGFPAFTYDFLSLDQANILLSQDIPIICDIQSFNHEGKGHYVVLTAIDGDCVYLMDPNTPGNQRVLTREHMDARWWDRTMAPPHSLKEKWGVVVLPMEG